MRKEATMPAIGIVRGWTMGAPGKSRTPQTVSVIEAQIGDPRHEDGFTVTYLEAGDAFRCHSSHVSRAQEQLGDDISFRAVEMSDEDVETALREDRVLVRWRDLGLVFPDSNTPPPARFVLLRVDDPREHPINALRAAVVRVFSDKKKALIWARACAASLTLD